MDDARGRLHSDPFAWRHTKAGELVISRGGRVVMTLGGPRALRLVSALAACADDHSEQLLLAKATGHYKH